MKNITLKIIGIAAAILLLNACTKNDDENKDGKVLLTKEIQPYYTYTNVYNSNGLSSTSNVSFTYPNWQGYNDEYYYDNNNFLSEVISTQTNDSSYKIKTIFERDNNNRIISKKQYEFSNNTLGNLLEYFIFTYYGNSIQWVKTNINDTSIKYETRIFEYDNLGNLEKISFYSGTGNLTREVFYNNYDNKNCAFNPRNETFNFKRDFTNNYQEFLERLANGDTVFYGSITYQYNTDNYPTKAIVNSNKGIYEINYEYIKQ